MRAPPRPPLALSLLAALCACETAPAPPPSTAPLEGGGGGRVRALDAGVWRGICLAHNWQDGGERGYGSAASAEALDHARSIGADAVSITPFGWMRGLDATEIGSIDRPEAETDARLEAVIAQAKARGMRVVLKPHLWVGRGAWRGEIRPGDGQRAAWDAWFESYERFIVRYARLGRRAGADELVVGVELVSAVRADRARFIAVARAAAEAFGGPITYNANWDEALDVPFWRHFNRISVSFYAPLTDEPAPSVGAMRRAIAAHLDRWGEIARRAERPLVLGEVGYKSTPSGAAIPFGWPEALPESERLVDQRLQHDAYRALFLELAHRPEIGGVFLWKYFTDRATDEEGPWGFSPRGKRAEAIVRRAYAAPSSP